MTTKSVCSNGRQTRANSSIPEMNRESLMSMMKEIMQKTYMCNDELHYIAEESKQYSQSFILQQPHDNNQDDFKNGIQFMEEMVEVQKRNSTLTGFQNQVTNYFNDGSVKSTDNRNNSHSIQIKRNPSVCSLVQSRPQKTSSQTPEQSLNSVQSNEFDKLIEITSRCVEYYNNFMRQKFLQFQTIDKTFTDINNKLDSAFDEIINEAVKKQKQLKEFLHKKYQQIVEYRNQQDCGLKATLEDIKSVHLNNLLKKGKPNQKQTESSRNQFLSHRLQLQKELNNLQKDRLQQLNQSSQLSLQLHNYASTLNQFYVQMEQIQKSNFKEMVEESVSFINNLITEEIKVLMIEKIPNRLCENKIIRQNSKDFLLQENQNLQPDCHSSNLGVLDLDSFTKLFFQGSKLQAEEDKNRNLIQSHNLLKKKIQLKSEAKKITHKRQVKSSSKDKIAHLLEENELQHQKNDEKKETKKNNSNAACVSPIRKSIQKQQTKSKSKLGFVRKQTHYEVISPVKKCQKKVQGVYKQNSLQLIKKISSQQNNRSAKIKGYMVTFQNSSKACKNQNPSNRKNSIEKTAKTSKSPNNNVISKTPNKLNKSGDRRPMTSSNTINCSNEAKLKNSQQSSLRSSRKSLYISDFKIASSRRQSVAHKQN